MTSTISFDRDSVCLQDCNPPNYRQYVLKDLIRSPDPRRSIYITRMSETDRSPRLIILKSKNDRSTRASLHNEVKKSNLTLTVELPNDNEKSLQKRQLEQLWDDIVHSYSCHDRDHWKKNFTQRIWETTSTDVDKDYEDTSLHVSMSKLLGVVPTYSENEQRKLIFQARFQESTSFHRKCCPYSSLPMRNDFRSFRSLGILQTTKSPHFYRKSISSEVGLHLHICLKLIFYSSEILIIFHRTRGSGKRRTRQRHDTDLKTSQKIMYLSR